MVLFFDFCFFHGKPLPFTGNVHFQAPSFFFKTEITPVSVLHNKHFSHFTTPTPHREQHDIF